MAARSAPNGPPTPSTSAAVVPRGPAPTTTNAYAPLATAPLGCGRLVGLEDVAGPVELLLARREHVVEDRDLVGVQRPLAVEAEDLGAPAVVAEALGVAHLDVRAVDDLQPVGPAGHED